MSPVEVRLHGGPEHGKILPFDKLPREVFVVGLRPDPSGSHVIKPDNSPAVAVVPTRQGHYTPVAGSPGDYEWSGYIE